jgi:hypothetical protein
MRSDLEGDMGDRQTPRGVSQKLQSLPGDGRRTQGKVPRA